MKIKFEFKKTDQFNFNIRTLFRFPSLFVIIIVLVINAVTSIEYYQKGGMAVYIVHLVFFLICFIVLIVLLTAVLLLISSIAKDQSSVLCEHEIDFENDYFIEKTKLNENKYSWDAITKCYVSKNYFTLYVSGSTAHIIPRRYLSESENSQLLQLLKDKKKIK